MEFTCCEYLLHEIVFAQNSVIPCCCSPANNYESTFINNFSRQNFNINEYLNKRNEYITMLKSGNIPASCQGCSRLIKKEWDEENKINRIIITNRTKCSCNCIYCSLITTSNQTKEELNTRDTYDIIPVLKDMYNNNLIDNNCVITVAGGECSEYPKGELEFILYLALILNCQLEILSNGIIYSDAIAKVLQAGKCRLKISVDSGTKETFEKIKRVKAYNLVWKNLGEYIKNLNDNSSVVVKYIILPNYNDNLKEAENFLNNIEKINCKNIEIAIEYLWFEKNKNKPTEKNIKSIYEYFKKTLLNISFESEEIKEYLTKQN